MHYCTLADKVTHFCILVNLIIKQLPLKIVEAFFFLLLLKVGSATENALNLKDEKLNILLRLFVSPTLTMNNVKINVGLVALSCLVGRRVCE